MKIPKLCLQIAALSALLLAGMACQTAQKPVAAVPPQATAPAVQSAPAPAPAPQPQPAPSQPAAEAAAAPTAPKTDPILDLIAQVDNAYASGQENYKEGHHDLARADFDRAFNLLLSSPIDIHSDPRLLKEFDQVLASVNTLELEDLKQGTEQKSEPAPIDEANDVSSYPVDPSLKAKAEAEIQKTHSDLPLMLTDPVVSYINYYSTRGRGFLEHGLVRSGRYEDMVKRTLREEGVPQDLIYLAQAESGFHPLALSRAGARGMWQFMAMRAKGYGLERTPWVDERQDPEKSTRAAARHLKDLYNQFGDWYLAMAAYNSGPGTVQQAVKRTGYADFWELYKRNVLPKETRNYVPIILAVTIMAKNPAQYGLEDLNRDEPVPYDTVKIDYPVDLRLVAECVDVPTATLQDLNPSLLRLTTPPSSEFELHLPFGTKQQYLTAVADVPLDMRVWWRIHRVAAGDTLASIAHTYRVTPRAIVQANHFEEDGPLEADSKLVIPVAPGRRMDDQLSYSSHATAYKVRHGDTVETVAENFGVSATMVRHWNHLKGDSLAGRRVLYVHLPVSPSSEPGTHRVSMSKANAHSNLRASNRTEVVHHKVKSGETLNSIASSHHTTVTAIKRDNGNLAVLHPGMVLVIHGTSRQ
jgi:membrane-bound lytic murein transglycosylase D